MLSKRAGFEKHEVSPIGGSLSSDGSTRSSHESVRGERDVGFVEPSSTINNNW